MNETLKSMIKKYPLYEALQVLSLIVRYRYDIL
jgi:hypothetical protein